ncbi:MAG: hypothetical protein ACTSSH_12365, partial [Candidatus Heimdallarchaeota archaeon]
MSAEFYLGTAFRNIWHHKRQTGLFFLGIVISVSVITSLSIWSSTAENLAVSDFIKDQDFEIKVRSYLTSRLPDIKVWLDTQPLIDSTFYIYYNLAFFNAEDKDPFYRFWPLENQDDPSDPVSLATLLLLNKSCVKRLASQFSVQG